MNIQIPSARPLLGLDAALADAARRIQLTPTKHAKATANFEALCSYIDRPSSALHGRVLACYGSGSFGTGTAIATSVSRDQHDVDAVVELDIAANTDPAEILTLTFTAINGEPGSRYYGKVKQNSRCITVTYDDGVSVDLMPVARLGIQPEHASHAFHLNKERGEKYHKPVDPYDFKVHFNQHVAEDRQFAEAFRRQAVLAEDSAYVSKAETEPLPDVVPLEQKSPLVVAIQLIKRYRDIRFRHRPGQRKPPSVVINAIALELSIPVGAFVDVLIALASHLRQRIVEADRVSMKLEVVNPAWQPDVFTDRWPESTVTQRLFVQDLDHFVTVLSELKRRPEPEKIKEAFEDLFGETVANYAIEKHFEVLAKDSAAGRLSVGKKGFVTGATIAASAMSSITPVRANTNFGGDQLPE